MLDKLLQIETLSVVLLGDFNPVIFQPFWLSKKGLIREDEAVNAKVEVIHNEIVRYELNDWLIVEITRERCVFRTTKSPYFDPLRDLVLAVFKILKETPIKSLGINYIYDISLRSQESYYKFGNSLTPLNIWDSSMNDARLINLEIYEKERLDGKKGSRQIRISSTDQKIQFGISININNHFDLKDNSSNSELFNLLEGYWDNSKIMSRELSNNLLNKIQF